MILGGNRSKYHIQSGEFALPGCKQHFLWLGHLKTNVRISQTVQKNYK